MLRSVAGTGLPGHEATQEVDAFELHDQHDEQNVWNHGNRYQNHNIKNSKVPCFFFVSSKMAKVSGSFFGGNQFKSLQYT